MLEKKPGGIQPADIKPTDIEPTDIELEEIEPTDIELTDIEPTDIEPTRIEPTDIKPTEIKPTAIKPTKIDHLETPNIEPTRIDPTDIDKPLKTNSAPNTAVYKKGTAITWFCIAVFASIASLITGLINGISIYWGFELFFAVASFVFFFGELKKMQITQEDLDEWNKQILDKHPNINKKYLMKLEDSKDLTNRFSYWTHTFKMPFTKVIACILLPVAILSAVAGVIVPVTGVGGGIGGGSVVGTYISDLQDTGNIKVVSVTAYKFNSDNTYQKGQYDLETKQITWKDSGTYTKSGSKVTIEYGYFIVKNGGKKLQDGSGGYWIRI